MKFNEIEKELINTLTFDDILDPDLTMEEKVIYYEDLYNKAKEDKNKKAEDELTLILGDLITRGEEYENK